MPYIRFLIQADTEDEEPSRVIRKIDGAVFEYAGESDKEEQIGNSQCFLVPMQFARRREVSKHPTAREGKAKSEAHNLGNA
jgi:hypothetical protein